MGKFKKLIDKPAKKLSTYMAGKKKLQHILLAIVFFVTVFSFLAVSLKPEQFDVVIGQKAPADIYSPKDIEDRWETERNKDLALESVELVYNFDTSVHVQVKRDITNFFDLVYEIRQDEEIESLEEKQAILEEGNTLNLNNEKLYTALEAPKEKLELLETYIYEIAAQSMNAGLKVEDLQKEKQSIKESILNFDDFDDSLKELAVASIHASIRPNMFFDIEATEKHRQETIRSVERVMIRKGDLLLKEGDIVNYDDMELLRELGVVTEDGRVDIMLYLGIAAIVLVVEILLIAYIYVFNKDIFQQTDKLFMIYIIMMAILIMSKAIAGISIYLMPVAASAMLLSILIEPRLALLINLCLTILISIITGQDIIFIVMSIMGGTVGVFSMVNTQQRTNIFVSGFVVSLVNIAAIIGIGFINSNEAIKVLTYGFYGVINGVFCAILTVGTLPLWEYMFNIITPLKLVELFNPNQPLLKKLLIEAPGTYHHSIIVGNLSESAADAVGANPLLARVGAFYHDIGKIKRPYFFKENQLSAENPHDKLNPSLSSLIITGHVKDGMELAKKYKLPSEISDFIEQHHGNTLVAYFYHKAKTGEHGDSVDEQSFRYNGPKPKTKEIAIVMLADSVEAAVRSMSSPSKDKIEKLIDKIIEDKLADGQLDQCDITLKELNIIKKTFVKIILGIFHERIEYPEQAIKELKGRKPYGASN
ncbi:MAG: HDIG domain-containing protein [Clostridiaceae bacterium]|nr:HDIG domain-containing protein [Clostridiaceae bacterium]